jgi:hypothetical protein
MTWGVMRKLGILRVVIPISQNVVVFWVFNSCLSVSSWEKVPSRIGNSGGIRVFTLTQKQWSSYRELSFPLSNTWVMSKGIRVTACELCQCPCCNSRIFLFPMLKEYKGYMFRASLREGFSLLTMWIYNCEVFKRLWSGRKKEMASWAQERGCGLGEKTKWAVELKRER